MFILLYSIWYYRVFVEIIVSHRNLQKLYSSFCKITMVECVLKNTDMKKFLALFY
jgi:hypothetical protein